MRPVLFLFGGGGKGRREETKKERQELKWSARMRKEVRKDQKNAGESKKLKYPLKIGCFCSIFPFRTGQRANSTETADGQSNWRNQSKQKAAAQRRTWPTTLQRHELSPHSDR